MGNFTLDLKVSPEHLVEYNGFEVVIQPLNKQEDIKLVKKYTSGKVKVLQGQKKRGFREKQRDELLIPDVEYFELNLARAKLTWKTWNIKDSKGVEQECNADNITAIFNLYYNELAEPVLERLEDVIAEYNKELDNEGKN